jgi:formate-dependent nitrite reductase membrane component NrfD
MPEITIYGANEMTYPALHTWGWEIAVYLFLGGLVAGMMILSGAFRAVRSSRFGRANAVADILGLPFLGIGMLLLFIDLANRMNVWRLYTTFQVSSPMSWGSWILLVTMALLAVRFVMALPIGWKPLRRLAASIRDRDRVLGVVTIVLGVSVGFYTGVLLSSIQARPLWDGVMLAPLFLTSGLAGGAALTCLFLEKEEHARLVPFSIVVCAVELVLIGAYFVTIAFGSATAREAAPLLFGGTFGLLFWGVVVLLGLVAPATAETIEAARHRVIFLSPRVPPVLKLAGGLTLRFVIVYAGLRGFV